jgi:hypothetical protein
VTACPQHRGLDLVDQLAAGDTAEEAGRRHHQDEAPDHFARAGEEACRHHIDHQGEHLLEGVQPRQRLVDDEPEHRQEGDAQPGPEVPAVDRYEVCRCDRDRARCAVGSEPIRSHLRM